MGVETTHPQFDAWRESWQKMADVTAGQERIHYAGEAYLPRLVGQNQQAYEAYLRRALFLNATARTVDGLSGLIFRKPPQVEHPSGMDDFMEDVDLAGQPFQAFAEDLVEEVITIGRVGLLVDFPQADGAQRTRAEADAMGQRPYWTLYPALKILNWQTMQLGNRTVLGQVRLSETIELPKNEFECESVDQIRVLSLDETDSGVRYQQRLFRRKVAGGLWEDVTEEVTGQSVIVPLMNGSPMQEIPFIFLSPRNLTPSVHKPPLLDLAEVNIAHYQVYADYRHFLFKLAPTPYLFGVNEDEIPQGIGADALWISRNEGATAGIVQADASGMGNYRQALEDLKGDMATLGARMLAPEKRQVEAAETAAIHRMGETSVLSSLAQAVSMGLARAMEWAAEWMGADPAQVVVDLNRDFMPVTMGAQDLTALVQSWQQGAISDLTLFQNLQRGEIISDNRSFEEERAEVQTSGSAVGDIRSLLNG